jgi:Holliday junction resolvase RusA-like endonuclease
MRALRTVVFVVRDPREYQFVIPGACPPKGSRTPVGRGRATRESSKRVAPWTEKAREIMQDAYGQPLARFEGPVCVTPLFVFKRPKVTEYDFPTAPSIGDLDKLLRCLLDALTKARVIEDDRFVVEFGERPRKIWGDESITVVKIGRVLTGLADVSTFGESPGTRYLATNPVDTFRCSHCAITEPHDHEMIDVSGGGFHREFMPGPAVRRNPYI